MEARRYWGLGLVLVLGLLLPGSLVFGADQAYFTALQLTFFAKPADLPEISLATLDDKSVSLRTWRGRVVLLNFWTTW